MKKLIFMKISLVPSSLMTKTGSNARYAASPSMKRKTSSLVLVIAFAIATVSRTFGADIDPPRFFQETFSFPLGDYWCENHLSVADVDGDGRQDIVLMATGLA